MYEWVTTGVSGVDELSNGKDIPQGYTMLISGGPGSGKTTFGIQFLYEGAKKFNEAGL